MHIAIPSKGRAGAVKSLKVVPQATLYVPEAELADYIGAQYSSIVGVPRAVRGITATRNWILDHVDDEWIVMLDDDVKSCGWRHLLDESSAVKKLTSAQWEAEFFRLFELTEDLGLRLWGVSTESSLRSVYPWRPFIFHTYVTASCCGIINQGLRFDERYTVKEDYELCLRCIKEDGGILGARYLFWENSHWTDEGGCKSYRTQAVEEDAIRRLIGSYANLIRRVTRGGSSYSIELDF